MMHMKKISVDALQIALILALVRFGPEVLFNNHGNVPLEVGETFLGATVGYRRFSSPNNYALSHRYVNLKTLDSLIMDRTMVLRDQLAHLRNYDEHRNDIYAYYNEQNAKAPEPALNEATERNSSDSNPPFNPSVESWQPGHDGGRRDSVELLENFQEASVVDLSPEDMGLIEILWKQDIDLGVSKEAYGSFDTHQAEKAKVEAEFCKEKVDGLEKANSISDKKHDPDLEDSEPEFVNQWEGLNYTIDDETGEYILQDQKLDDDEQNLPPELSLFNGDGFDDLSANLFSTENDTSNFNFTKLSLDDDDDDDEALQQPLDDFLPNLDELFAEVEKLEESISESESDNVNYGEASEMYPSMEEYWHDISTTLPLSVGGAFSSAPIAPRPIRAYPVPSEIHTDVLPSSSEFLSRANDTFQGSAFLQNNTLAPRSSDINTTFGCLPSMLGTTSLGCAVASSITALTNDTDPMPDVSGVLNGTYGLDLPVMLHPNQTSALPTSNETLMSDLLMANDLQFMDTAAAPSTANSDEASCHTLTIGNENMELSNDSVVSSMSGSTSSACNENQCTNFEELSSVECSSKESVYTTLKYPFHSPYMSPGYRQPEASAHNHNCGFNASSYRNRNDYSHYLQHNHSYHLPFTNSNASPKPVTRDKSRPSKYDDDDDDDAQNRDEKRAKALKLPITINDIINLGIEEFNEKITKFDLTEPQQTLIRDIRRRGKNKVAAQNCRKRKMDQISNLQQALDCLENERLQLESERAQLLHQRHNVQDKYAQLCQFVIQSTNHHQRIPNNFSSTLNNNSSVSFSDSAPSTSNSTKSDETIFNQGVRAKKKFDKRRLDFP